MGSQEIVVGLIVVGAVVWLLRTLIVRARGGGCECASASTCPYAGGPDCALTARSTPPAAQGEQEDRPDE